MKHDTIFFDDDPSNEEGFETVVMQDWSSFGIMLDNPNQPHVMQVIETVDDMMTLLIKDEYAKKWFFLYEGDVLAVRFLRGKRVPKTLRQKCKERVIEAVEENGLIYQENSFATYKEKKGKLFNDQTVEAFAEMMCATTTLWTAKRKFMTNFSNYRFMERVGHCMFNVLCGGYIHGIKDERYFLHQRIQERSRLLFDEEFEDCGSMPKVQLKQYYEAPRGPVVIKPRLTQNAWFWVSLGLMATTIVFLAALLS